VVRDVATGLGDHLPERPLPREARRQLAGPGQVGDHRVTEPAQVCDRELDAPLVVARDRGQRDVVRAPVDEHGRYALLEQLTDRAVLSPRRPDEQAVDLAGLQGSERRALALWLVVRVGDDRGVARAVQLDLRAPD